MPDHAEHEPETEEPGGQNMSKERIVKRPCSPCPFSRVNTLFLHPERASDFAFMAQNPYTDFVCHKTGVSEENESGGSSIVRGEKSATCCGFKSLQASENGGEFEPHPDAFCEVYEMIEHHEEEWLKSHPDYEG